MTEDRANPLDQHRRAMANALEASGGQAVIDYNQVFDGDQLWRVQYVASKPARLYREVPV